MKNKMALLAVILLTSAIFFGSCSKDDNVNGSSTLHLRLTDAPAALDSVFVEIEEVRIKMHNDTTESGWITMNTNSGIYNLLELQNGVDTLLGTATLPTGTVKEVRFIVGTENRVVADGQSYPLTIPSGAESGLKIKVNKSLNATIETLIIDFDAALSVHEENGNYKLRPVLRVL